MNLSALLPSLFELSIPSDQVFSLYDTSFERQLNADKENTIGWVQIWCSCFVKQLLVNW